MKVLFLDYQHYPAPDANGNCVEMLRRQLGMLGITSDVLTFRTSYKIPQQQSDANGRIYLESVWATQRKIKSNDGILTIKAVLHMPIAIMVRAAHRLFSDRYTVQERVFSWKACTRLCRKLSRLCRENHYDWVVAVSGPYCVHEVAIHAKLQQVKLALYYLDPFSAHELFPKENREGRIRRELQVLSKADAVFAPLEHESDWRTTELSRYMDKVHFLPYPNLQPYGGPPSNAEKANEVEIDLLYIGALHDEVRYPQAMLLLFERMLALEPHLRLSVVGYKSGAIVKQQLSAAQRALGDRLICEGPVPLPQAMKRIRQADCVINLGNWMKNQMPSKLLDYIAQGKAILNISHNRPCNTAPYIDCYPWKLQIYEQELKNEEVLQKTAENAVAFVREHRGKCLKWVEIEKAMSGFTAQDVAKQFLAVLQEHTCAEKR